MNSFWFIDYFILSYSDLNFHFFFSSSSTSSLQFGLFFKDNQAGKKLNASQAFDETWNTAPDLENELEVSISLFWNLLYFNF